MSAPSDPGRVRARFFDGRSAAGRDVFLNLSQENLVLRDETGARVAEWPRAQIHRASPPGSHQPRLRLGWRDDARISLADGDLDKLKPFLRNLDRRESAWRETWRPILIFSGAAAISLWLLVVVIIPQAAGVIADHIPHEWESEIGNASRDQVIRILAQLEGRETEAGLVCSGRGALTLRRAGRRLWRGAGGNWTDLNLTVADLDLVNAFALPGGQIIVTRGLIDEAENGNEVAAVLAHEMGHVAHRHPTKVAFEQGAVSALLGLLVGDVFGGAVLAGIGDALLSSAYSRDAEREADAWAIDRMNAEDYDVRPMADFFERLHAEQGDVEQVLALVASHPLSANRAERVRGEATGRGLVFTPAEWESVRKACG